MTITLATLPQATAQEVYSQVRKHLLTQGIQSMIEFHGCQYRGPDGHQKWKEKFGNMWCIKR